MQSRVKNVLIFGVLIVVSVAGIIVARQQFPVEEASPQGTQVSTQLLSPQEFDQFIQDEQVFVLDVHTPEQVHIPGTDAVIAFDQLAEKTAQLPQDKSTPIAVYCRSGGMSAEAVKTLAEMGYTNVFELEGGLQAYQEAKNQVALWPETQDIGTVVYGDVTETTFTLTNLTPLPLNITRVSTSCGCTSAEVEQAELAAYEQTSVRVAFDPAVHEDDTDLGDITRTIYLSTDNPNFPELSVNITGTVIKENSN